MQQLPLIHDSCSAAKLSHSAGEGGGSHTVRRDEAETEKTVSASFIVAVIVSAAGLFAIDDRTGDLGVLPMLPSPSGVFCADGAAPVIVDVRVVHLLKG